MHTPTPWSYSTQTEHFHGADGSVVGKSPEDRAFVLKACNSHDALVETLQANNTSLGQIVTYCNHLTDKLTTLTTDWEVASCAKTDALRQIDANNALLSQLEAPDKAAGGGA